MSIIEKIAIDNKYIDFHATEHGGWHEYQVTLAYKDRQFTTSYQMGSGHTDEPTATSVIEALFADSATIESAGDNFEDWCAELGYNPDSIKDLHTFTDCQVNKAGLEFRLGADIRKVAKEVEDV